MTTPAKYVSNKPTADQTGPALVGDVKDCLQSLRDSVLAGVSPGWNFVSSGTEFGGSYAFPKYLGWYNYSSKEWVSVSFTWLDDELQSAAWRYRADADDEWLDIGVETPTWDAAGNLTSVVWSGDVTYPAFDKSKPVTGDTVLETVDFIRENLMALRDDFAAEIGDHWAYATTVGSGTAEEPQYLAYSSGSETLRAEYTRTNSYVDSITWQFDDGGGYDDIGTTTFVYDSAGNLQSFSWSASSGYTEFVNGGPSGNESSADDSITVIRENMIALAHANLIGTMPGWGSFWQNQNAGFSAEQPEAWVQFLGSTALVVVNSYGTSGFEKDAYTQQELIYTEDAGVTLTTIGKVKYLYGDDGLIKTATWDNSDTLTVGDAGFTLGSSSGGMSGTWDDSLTWDDTDVWSDT